MHLSSYSLIFTIMQPILSSFIILTTFNKRDIHHLLSLRNDSHYDGWLTLLSTYCSHMSTTFGSHVNNIYKMVTRYAISHTTTHMTTHAIKSHDNTHDNTCNQVNTFILIFSHFHNHANHSFLYHSYNI